MGESTAIAAELEKRTGIKGKRIVVRMRGVRDLSRFIRTMNTAIKQACKSTTRYGEGDQA